MAKDLNVGHGGARYLASVGIPDTTGMRILVAGAGYWDTPRLGA
ncbi:MAG: hypothetical protein ACLPVY_12365 [Acidimicrobiia bacterium]